MQQKLSFTIKKVLFLVEGSVGVWLFFKQKNNVGHVRFLCLTYELFSGEKNNQTATRCNGHNIRHIKYGSGSP